MTTHDANCEVDQLLWGECFHLHTEQPCKDNPQPCGCNPCCCPMHQGVCDHLQEQYARDTEGLRFG